VEEHEIIDFIFAPGFSTKDQVSEISGRGVGMDVAKEKMASSAALSRSPQKKIKGQPLP